MGLDRQDRIYEDLSGNLTKVRSVLEDVSKKYICKSVFSRKFLNEIFK